MLSSTQGCSALLMLGPDSSKRFSGLPAPSCRYQHGETTDFVFLLASDCPPAGAHQLAVVVEEADGLDDVAEAHAQVLRPRLALRSPFEK